jgi:hypothetical protein
MSEHATREGLKPREWDHACDFLLKLKWENLFEQLDQLWFRCKGCGGKIPRSARESHFRDHQKNVTTAASDDVRRRMQGMADKTPKQTAKDQGVPAVYLSESGNFKPGMDARYKSDLISAVLGLDLSKALHKFTAADAESRLAQRNWIPFLERKRALIKEKAAAAKEQAEKKATATRERAAAKAEAKAKAPAKVKDEVGAKRQAKSDPKPAARKTTAAARRRAAKAKK